jgi:Holliday junction resolvasome RuvABC ATP-dependent DNA helicase subunit
LTIIAATTKPKMLDDAVLDRFQFRPAFVDYTNEEMAEIITGMISRVDDIDITLTDDQIVRLANAANGKPRMCRQIVLAARACFNDDADMNDPVMAILSQAGVDEDGLDLHALNYLNMINRFGGVAGLAKLSGAMNLTPGHVQDIEKSLFRQEFIDHSDRGRRLTAKGYNKITTGNKEYTRKNAR